MSSTILTVVNKFYRKYNIIIPLKGNFVPGKHCPGEKPFGKSHACYVNCMGTKGLSSYHNIPLPCQTETQFEKNVRRGIAGI